VPVLPKARRESLAAIGHGFSLGQRQTRAGSGALQRLVRRLRTRLTTLAQRARLVEGPSSEAVPFTFRLKFPANYKLPAHWHPEIEHVTVISGTFNMGTGDKLDMQKTKALTPGSAAIMQPKTDHFAWTGEKAEVQVHGVGPWAINYVNPADDPRKK
jgi:hypothetical protein